MESESRGAGEGTGSKGFTAPCTVLCKSLPGKVCAFLSPYHILRVITLTCYYSEDQDTRRCMSRIGTWLAFWEVSIHFLGTTFKFCHERHFTSAERDKIVVVVVGIIAKCDLYVFGDMRVLFYFCSILNTFF